MTGPGQPPSDFTYLLTGVQVISSFNFQGTAHIITNGIANASYCAHLGETTLKFVYWLVAVLNSIIVMTQKGKPNDLNQKNL